MTPEQIEAAARVIRTRKFDFGYDDVVLAEEILTAAAGVGDEQLRARIAELEAQLPEGMKHCTIQFRECPVGHGMLTATNWVQHECFVCRIAELEAEVGRLNRELKWCSLRR